jgi:hypothetical protein
MNMTDNDWPLRAIIEGAGFFGPPSILAKAYQTTNYPLMFRPQNERDVAVSHQLPAHVPAPERTRSRGKLSRSLILYD